MVAVTYGVLVGCVLYRNLSLRNLWGLMTEAAVTSGVVMFIIALAGIFAWAGTTLGTFQHLADALLSLSENGWALVFTAAMAVSLALVMLVPGIALWLPEKLGYVVGPW